MEFLADDPIITPHALPMFREERAKSTKKIQEKARADPVKSHRPDLPVQGPGKYILLCNSHSHKNSLPGLKSLMIICKI